MKIGKVKWFGACNDKGVYYGFLEELDSKKSVYFNERSIDRTSGFLEKNDRGKYHSRENVSVVYELRPARDPDKLSAFSVKMLDELDGEALQKLYRECCEGRRAAELGVLIGYDRELFAKEPPAFFIPYLDDWMMQGQFVQDCKKLGSDELKEALEGHLTEKPVMDLLAGDYPELFFDRDPAPYFPYMNKPKVSKLFEERYRSGYISEPVARIYGEWLQTTKSAADACLICGILDLEKEPQEDIIFFLTQAKKRLQAIYPLLQSKPELIGIPEVCAGTDRNDLEHLHKKIPMEKLVQTKEQAVFLKRYLRPWAWCFVVEHLSGKLLLRFEKGLEYMTDEKAVSLFSELDWNDTSGENPALYQPLLSGMDTNHFPKAVMAAVVSMREKGAEFNLTWWKLLSDSVKIRLLIYLSNFKEERQKWFEPIKEIYQWETENKNLLICAMLNFFVMIYTPNPARQRAKFLEAHGMLVNYIAACFSEGIDVTMGLYSLLDNCVQKRPGATGDGNFCEARIWTKKEEDEKLVFCPEKRYPCSASCFYGGDLRRTKFRINAEGDPDYSTQFFMDYLVNLGEIPDLSELGVRDRTEYPFRISAYVNSFVRMRRHMKCKRCGEPFRAKFEFAKLKTATLSINRFQCPHADAEPDRHDKDVYLNFCFRCHKIIDSRDCKLRDDDGHGQYLCMHCGGTNHTEPGTVCPQCGCDDGRLISMRGGDRIQCRKCGYDSALFKSWADK